MPAKRRYLVAHRYGPIVDSRTRSDLETFVAAAAGASIVRRTRVGRTVLELTREQASELSRANPRLVVEEDSDLVPFAMPGLPPRVPAGEARRIAVEVLDAADGKPLSDVTIYGVGGSLAYKAVTDGKGAAVLEVQQPTLTHLVASARDGFWSQILPGEAVQGTARFSLRGLLSHGGYDWGHRLLGIRAVQRFWRGCGIRVAIVDSGIAKGQDDLKPAGGVDTLDAEDPKSWDVDEKGHGTHVAGIVASLDTKAGLLGGAPDAETFSVKVLPGGRLSDLVEAIEWCIAERMDVVNLSLGSRTPSEVLAGALRDAYDRGMTCVAAAGNESGAVAFPASAPTVIAVGAVGKYGTFPEDSAHALCATELADRRGELFAAAFSNSGPEVELCAPGVAVLSTVPTGYSAWDGTSAAAPFVTSLAALVLEAYPHLRTGDEGQPEAVRAVLRASAFDLGLPPEFQGAGLPSAIRALRAATPRRFAERPR